MLNDKRCKWYLQCNSSFVNLKNWQNYHMYVIHKRYLKWHGRIHTKLIIVIASGEVRRGPALSMVLTENYNYKKLWRIYSFNTKLCYFKDFNGFFLFVCWFIISRWILLLVNKTKYMIIVSELTFLTEKKPPLTILGHAVYFNPWEFRHNIICFFVLKQSHTMKVFYNVSP